MGCGVPVFEPVYIGNMPLAVLVRDEAGELSTGEK
jgi:hypothetical protein